MYMFCMSLWFMAVLIQSIAKYCTLPELPKFSRPITSEQDQYEEGVHFYYGCVDNYHFENPDTDRYKVQCTNGHWYPKPFYKCTDDCKNRCQHGTCEKTLDAETRQTVANCLCNKNYEGDKCDARVCETLPLKPHHLPPQGSTAIGGGKYPLKSTIRFRCTENYAIKSGQYEAKCKPGGWDPSIPECEEIVCAAQEFLHGSSWSSWSSSKSSYKVGESVEFTCHSGYKIHGMSTSVCEKGGWSPGWPTCKTELLCTDHPPRVLHGLIIGPNHPPYTVGTKIQYKCQSRYYIEGRNVIRCSSYSGEPAWEQPPRCYPIDACGDKDKVIQKREGLLYCVPKGPLITTTVSSTVKPLTIVTATAGALLLLLLIVISLVAYQRRRIAMSNRRQDRVQLNNENDRFSFVYYTNDVHVVLPSYDEAVGVQGAPPPYGGNDTSDNTSNEQREEEDAAGSEHNQEGTEVIYEVIDETLRANYNQGQTSENNPHSSTSNEHTSISSEISDSNVLHKEVDTESDITSVISLNIDDPSDDTAPLIEE